MRSKRCNRPSRVANAERTMEGVSKAATREVMAIQVVAAIREPEAIPEGAERGVVEWAAAGWGVAEWATRVQ